MNNLHMFIAAYFAITLIVSARVIYVELSR